MQGSFKYYLKIKLFAQLCIFFFLYLTNQQRKLSLIINCKRINLNKSLIPSQRLLRHERGPAMFRVSFNQKFSKTVYHCYKSCFQLYDIYDFMMANIRSWQFGTLTRSLNYQNVETKVLFTDRCIQQNFCPSLLRLVDRLYTVIYKTQKTRTEVLPSANSR